MDQQPTPGGYILVEEKGYTLMYYPKYSNENGTVECVIGWSQKYSIPTNADEIPILINEWTATNFGALWRAKNAYPKLASKMEELHKQFAE